MIIVTQDKKLLNTKEIRTIKIKPETTGEGWYAYVIYAEENTEIKSKHKSIFLGKYSSESRANDVYNFIMSRLIGRRKLYTMPKK